MRETLSSFILLLSASYLLFLSTFSFIYCMYVTCVSSFSSVSLSSYRWACFGQRVGPAAPVHPARVRQPPHLPLTHLRRRDLHLHGEQLQGHRWGVRRPRGVGWVCRVRWLSHPFKKNTHAWGMLWMPKQILRRRWEMGLRHIMVKPRSIPSVTKALLCASLESSSRCFLQEAIKKQNTI